MIKNNFDSESKTDTKIIDRFEHRMQLTDESNDKFELKINKNESELKDKQKEIKEQIKKLHSELDEIQDNSRNLKKHVYSIGSILKDRLTKRDFDKLKEIIDAWPLEEYLTRNELERAFAKYAK